MDSTQARILISSLIGKSISGWYIDSLLGKGKSAVVMACTRGVEIGAIKVFHPELVERYGRTTQIERIMREKSLIGASHPNLVSILDGGDCPETGHLYVVMERLQYSNLHDLLLHVPAERILTLIAQVASAARFLEDRNLAHRDIKPENIAVSPDFTRAVLLDLGVLRPIGISNLTDIDQRSFIGTLRYSSPEFLQRKKEDTLEGWRAITFYQLGAVLHDLLMKRVLFEEDTEPFSLLVKAVNENIPVIHAESAKCVALANHCLIKNPTTRTALVTWERFQSLSIDDSSLASTRDRIAARQKYYQAVAPSKSTDRNHRLSKKELDDVCNRIESRIAALLNDIQAFPLRTTQSVKNVEQGVCETYIHFEKDEKKRTSIQDCCAHSRCID
ncbi:protein kinase [Rhodoferax sp. U2-2l]|uniref:serine/threonine protein kinase n=1 Tax=Rhodoferax sp. U2-2l TaxID=2884000 RepID=UPI001D0BC165|nr:protein kinase [Rhodoferax sp. U2-2l]MCB8747797.1 protein kinase [Rhodoferax sp. U2-2l]